MCPASGIICTAPRHRVGIATDAKIAPVDQLLFAAVKHGERDLEIARHLALVAGLAALDAGPEIAARPPVCAQNVIEEERRNIGKPGLKNAAT